VIEEMGAIDQDGWVPRSECTIDVIGAKFTMMGAKPNHF
jgi:hypothetical protein